jgi:hypothetical protein
VSCGLVCGVMRWVGVRWVGSGVGWVRWSGWVGVGYVERRRHQSTCKLKHHNIHNLLEASSLLYQKEKKKKTLLFSASSLLAWPNLESSACGHLLKSA